MCVTFLRITGVFLALALLTPAQVVPGRYIVELSTDPALAGRSRAAAMDRVELIRARQQGVRDLLAARGLRVRDSFALLLNGLVVEADQSQAAAISAIPGVLRVHPVELVRRYLDRALPLQSVNDAWQAAGGMTNSGLGVRIAILDSGIDSTHPAFQDKDLTPPEGFPKVNNSSDIGSTNSKVIVARNYDSAPLSNARDLDGHGTSVAMIAAGSTVSGPVGVITGVAPKAFLGNYKVFPDNSDFAPTDSVVKALEDAVADGMDVINLSLGSFPARLPSNDFMVTAVERAAAAGILIVVAAGNAGPDAATIGSPGTAPSVITVGNASSDRTFASTVRVPDRDPYLAVPASGSRNSSAVSAPVRDVAELDTTGLACSALPADSLTGRIAFILRGTCFFQDKLQNAQQAGASGAIIYTHADSPDPVTMDSGGVNLPAAMLSNADGLDLKQRLEGGTLTAQILFAPTAVRVNPARIAGSSSRGPSSDASLKPELLAIGSPVYTADVSSRGGGYQVATGTSLAAPMVTGAAAVVKAARPGLTSQHYRSLLVNAASTFSYDAVVAAPVQHTGAGLLNVLNAVRSTVAVAPVVANFGTGGSSPRQTVAMEVMNIDSEEDTVSVSVEGLGAGPIPSVQPNSVTVPAGGTRAVTLRFEASNLAPGQYQGFVTLRSSRSDAAARVPYWYAVPSITVFSVTAVPRSDGGNTGSAQQIFVRPADEAGLPVDTTPTATVVDGGGSAGAAVRSSIYPGFWVQEVRLGPAAGPNVFDISAGGKTTRVTIAGE
jgi:subtilisin family serine protease